MSPHKAAKLTGKLGAIKPWEVCSTVYSFERNSTSRRKSILQNITSKPWVEVIINCFTFINQCSGSNQLRTSITNENNPCIWIFNAIKLFQKCAEALSCACCVVQTGSLIHARQHYLLLHVAMQTRPYLILLRISLFRATWPYSTKFHISVPFRWSLQTSINGLLRYCLKESFTV